MPLIIIERKREREREREREKERERDDLHYDQPFNFELNEQFLHHNILWFLLLLLTGMYIIHIIFLLLQAW